MKESTLKYFTANSIYKKQLNKKWLPFAEYCDSCYLMLDFNPDQEGQDGKIICYSHDPDEIIYVVKSFTELIEGIMEVIV